MKLREAFTSKAAIMALTLGMASGTAVLAQAPHSNAVPARTDQTQITTTGHLAFGDPLMPTPVIALTLLLYAAVCMQGGRHKSRGIVPRTILGAAFTLAMFNPEWVREVREKLPTTVLVVDDLTDSEKAGARDKMIEAADTNIVSQLTQLSGVAIRKVTVANAKDGVAIDGTHIFSSIAASMTDIPSGTLGGVIVLTDGRNHDTPTTPALLGSGVPLHVFVSGHENEYDRSAVIDDAPYSGVVNAKAAIHFHVQDEGPLPGSGNPVRITIKKDGKDFATQLVTPGTPAETNIPLSHAGENIVEITVDPVAGELTTVNNQAAVSVQGVLKTMNVLLISGAPSMDTKVFRDLLKSDPDIEAIHFVVSRLLDSEDYTPTEELSLRPFPSNEIFSPEMLKKFDMVIFDSYEDNHILSSEFLENIADYGKNGGAILVVSGSEYAKEDTSLHRMLSSILPDSPTGHVTEQLYAPLVTAAGKRHPVTRDLKGCGGDGFSQCEPWTLLTDTSGASGEILMEGPGHKPLLILAHEKEGRIVHLLADSLWRWQKGDKGGPSAELLQGATHWALGDRRYAEESLHLIRQGEKLFVEQQTMEDKSTPVTVRKPSGETLTVTPEGGKDTGLWRAEVPDATELGAYSASQGGAHPATAFINVGQAHPRELEHTTSTMDILKPLVAQTPGAIVRLANSSGALTIPRIVLQTPGQAANGMHGPGWAGIVRRETTNLNNTSRTPVSGYLGFVILSALLYLSIGRETGSWNPFRKKEPPAGPMI